MSDDFLSRWSRRKTQARTGSVSPPDTDPAAYEPEEPTAPLAHAPPEAGVAQARIEPANAEPMDDEPTLGPEEIAALPPVETLHAGSDFTQFLRRGVPAALKSAALRQLWVSDPGIRDFVGEARDYAWDWNVAGGVPGTGPLAPGTDVEGMVRRIFGNRENDEAGGKTADAQAGEMPEGEPPNPAPAGTEEPVAPPESPQTDISPAAHAEITSAVDTSSDGSDAKITLSPHSRKHGSATPFSSLE